MLKKSVLLSTLVGVLVLMTSFAASGSNGLSLACEPSHGGVVDKTVLEPFTAKIELKNTGKAEGTWSVNVVFEGELWIWEGTAKILTLKPSESKMLSWEGTVPEDAPVDSVARLVVYYNDSFTALDWWIHVVPSAELTITESIVK
jgi:hypothetical protein